MNALAVRPEDRESEMFHVATIAKATAALDAAELAYRGLDNTRRRVEWLTRRFGEAPLGSPLHHQIYGEIELAKQTEARVLDEHTRLARVAAAQVIALEAARRALVRLQLRANPGARQVTGTVFHAATNAYIDVTHLLPAQ